MSTTHGTITHGTTPIGKAARRPAWIIAARPHVALRIKRIFPRVQPESSADRIVLLDTVETSREILWFTERYPMAMSEPDRARLMARAAEHREREQLILSILSAEYAPPAVDLALPLRSYQALAVDLVRRSGTLLLADDVGLGKTAVGIGLMADKLALPAVVVTLTHLPRQWAAEIARFAPRLRVHVAKTSNPGELKAAGVRSRLLIQDIYPEPDVYVLNYHKLAGWKSYLAERVRSIIFDEAQELRRSGTAKSEAAAELGAAAAYRLALSATPIYNYGGEIYNVITSIAPDALGTAEEFEREWCGAVSNGRPSIKDPKAFGVYLRDAGLMLRRTRAEVGRELPPLTKITQTIDADLDELKKVETSATELARIILTQGGLEKGAKLRASEELSWLLRQATGIAKARAVADFVEILRANGERVVLFGWHRAVYDLWRERLKDHRPAFYTGGESVAAKDREIGRFKAGETDILVMSLRAGAGVDGLQGSCRTVVFGEIDWSPGVHDQCIGRIHRDGQGDPVMAYFLLAESGSDPVVADVLGLKRQQSEAIRDPYASLVEELQVDEGHVKRLAERYLAQQQQKRGA